MFYVDLWLGHYPTSLAKVGRHDKFTAGKVALSGKMVQDFLTVIGNAAPSLSSHEPLEDGCVPLDLCSVVAWDALVQPVLIPALDGDRLRILHRSNEFEYYPGVEPIRVGDVLEIVSHIEGITIFSTGKLVEVVADIRRGDTRVVKVTAAFLILGSFAETFQDYENTFKIIKEKEMENDISSEGIQELLLGKKWLEVEDEPELLGSRAVFRLKFQATFNNAGTFSSPQVTGHAYNKNDAGIMIKLGDVYYQAGPSSENPVMDFLNGYGAPTAESQPLKNPVWKDNSSWKIRTPPCNGRTLAFQKTRIPFTPPRSLHCTLTCLAPSHTECGMYNSAAVRRLIEKSAANAKSAPFRRYAASCDGLVFPGDELRVEMQHVAMIDDFMVLKIQAYNDQTNEKS
jgi:fatty acid synthase subunit beta